MAKLFQIRFDARAEEIETAYKAFQSRYALKKKILYTVVYLIVLVLGVDLIVKNPTGIAGYIAAGLSAGILLFNWIKPVMIRKKLVKTLAELDDETYTASFYDDRIEIETVIEKNENDKDKDKDKETIAITASGVYPVEEGSLAAEEAKKAEAENEKKQNEPIPKTVYRLAETEIFFEEKDGLFLLFVNRSYIHTIPGRCLAEEEKARLKEYFDEKLTIG
ncbi:MAG: hypothetical protein NC084_02345 [Bacteroides sp.]|nr:hypothetical protein [Eubacterium sp.]MCM1419529.1 hypothetical protein [Roseburia sp.]MCM1461536.1 hypothetical protein [Bacteroides sp.]